jgi:hypothetical protein
MTIQSTDPVFSEKTITERVQSITAAPGGAGVQITHTAATSLVVLRNIGSAKWDVEYRVGSGEWLALGPLKSVSLTINLATTALRVRRGENSPLSTDVLLTLEGVPGSLLVGDPGIAPPEPVPPVPGDGIQDADSLTLAPADADTVRIAAGTQTYTINAATAWAVGKGVAIFLPASGTVSVAVTGGPTINGGTSTLTRTLAGNALGYVVLNRIAGADAYSLSGA